MLTNIVATIAIAFVTNVVEVDNEWVCPHCNVTLGEIGSNIYTLDMPHFANTCVKRTPATEKTKTTTVKEITTIKFNALGEDWTGRKERVVSTKVENPPCVIAVTTECSKVKWKKKEEWEKQP